MGQIIPNLTQQRREQVGLCYKRRRRHGKVIMNLTSISYRLFYWIQLFDHNDSYLYFLPQNFTANYDCDTIITNELNPAISRAMFVRIHPQEWQKRIALRFDILGCKTGR